MEYNILNASIVGLKNRIKSKDSQDYSQYINEKEYCIAVVADGHSTEFFKWSKEGAVIACKVAISILKKYITKFKYREEINLYLNDIKNEIYNEWMKKVEEHFYQSNNKALKVEYLRYSTTLLAVVITNQMILAIRVGDGNITIRDNDEYKKIFKNSNKYIVDSLGRLKSKEYFKYHIENIENKSISQISVFTDGYEYGFASDKKLYNELDLVNEKYNKNVFVRHELINNYIDSFSTIDNIKMYDDITIIHLLK